MKGRKEEDRNKSVSANVAARATPARTAHVPLWVWLGHLASAFSKCLPLLPTKYLSLPKSSCSCSRNCSEFSISLQVWLWLQQGNTFHLNTLASPAFLPLQVYSLLLSNSPKLQIQPTSAILVHACQADVMESHGGHWLYLEH